MYTAEVLNDAQIRAMLPDYLTALTESLASLERCLQPGNVLLPESVSELRRQFHTLKSRAALMGMTEVSALCKAQEDVWTSALQRPVTTADTAAGLAATEVLRTHERELRTTQR